MYLENLLDSKAYSKKKVALKKELSGYLEIRFKNWANATPEDVRLFLLEKEKAGKTQVHDLDCQFVGCTGLKDCFCPKRLAAGTVSSTVAQLKSLFDDMGKRGEWVDSGIRKYGNPILSNVVDRYVKAIKLEQARAHVPIKQAKPLFLDKLRKISEFIDQKLIGDNSGLGNRFILLRDQSFFKLQFFAGDRAHDLSLCLAQEVKKLPHNQGLVFCHTVGKTLGNGKTNQFVIAPVTDKTVCPVNGLYRYVTGAKGMDIELNFGYLFRTLDLSHKKVLESPVSSSGMNARLQTYLKALGIFEGETVHGLRGGSAITLASNSVASGEEIMDHIGWRGRASLERYSRMRQLSESSSVGAIFAKLADSDAGNVSDIYDKFGDFSLLPLAF